MGRRIFDSLQSASAKESEQSSHDNAGRIIFMSGEINEELISTVSTQLISLSQQDHSSPINLIISTYGGGVDEMFALFDIIKFINVPVLTMGIGKVMSAGTFILAAGKKGERKIGRNASVMIHPMTGCVAGNIFQLQSDVAAFRKRDKQLIDAYVKETKMSKKAVEKIMRRGLDYYIDADESVKLGIADIVVG